MLTLILQILTLIGYFLLCLLCVLILILAIVLFYPISYRFVLNKDESTTNIEFRLKWLMGLVKAIYEFPGSKKFQLYILGKPYNVKKKAKDDKVADTSKVDLNNIDDNDTEIKHNDSGPDEHGDFETVEDDERASFVQRLKLKIAKYIHKFNNIRDNIIYYYNLIKDEGTHSLFTLVFGEISNLIRYLKPKKKKAELIIGTGSPDTTGYLYGIYGMFVGTLGPKFIVIPDFHNKIFQGELEFSGNINIIKLLLILLRIYKSKDFAPFMEKVKKRKG